MKTANQLNTKPTSLISVGEDEEAGVVDFRETVADLILNLSEYTVGDCMSILEAAKNLIEAIQAKVGTPEDTETPESTDTV